MTAMTPNLYSYLFCFFNGKDREEVSLVSFRNLRLHSGKHRFGVRGVNHRLRLFPDATRRRVAPGQSLKRAAD